MTSFRGGGATQSICVLEQNLGTLFLPRICSRTRIGCCVSPPKQWNQEKPLPTEELLEDTDELLRRPFHCLLCPPQKGGRGNQPIPVASRRGSLLPSVSADAPTHLMTPPHSEGGYHDVEDVLFDAEWLEAGQLIEMLSPHGAKPVDIRRMTGAVKQLAAFGPELLVTRQHIGTYEAAQSPLFEPRAYAALCGWLNSVKPGYSRFAAAFVAAGYEDAEDLKADLPTPQQLQQMLAGTTTAKSPQIQHLMRALAALEGSEHKSAKAELDDGRRHSAEDMCTPHKYILQPASSTTTNATRQHQQTTPGQSTTAMASHGRRVSGGGGGGGSVIAQAGPDDSRTDATAGASPATGLASLPPPAAVVSAAAAAAAAEAPRLPSSVALPVRRRASTVTGSKHVFLSYQWDVQPQVVEVKKLLNDKNVKCWMDIDGGMKSDIYDSMAEGVQGAACVVCFMTQAYHDSANCKLELKFAQQSGVPIIPCMMEEGYTAKGWLGKQVLLKHKHTRGDLFGRPSAFGTARALIYADMRVLYATPPPRQASLRPAASGRLCTTARPCMQAVLISLLGSCSSISRT